MRVEDFWGFFRDNLDDEDLAVLSSEDEHVQDYADSLFTMRVREAVYELAYDPCEVMELWESLDYPNNSEHLGCVQDVLAATCIDELAYDRSQFRA